MLPPYMKDPTASFAKGPTPDEMRQITDGAAYAALLPKLSQDVEGMKKSLQMKVFGLIRAGALTPEAALAYWIELKSLNDLVARFSTRVTIGTEVGKQVAPAMNIGD